MWREETYISYFDTAIDGGRVGPYFAGVYPAVSCDGKKGLVVVISDEGSSTIIAANWGNGWWTDDDALLPEEVKRYIEELMYLWG